MSRISIDVSTEEHRKLKAFAALQGKSMKDYLLEGKLDPSDFFHVLIPNNALQVESVTTRTRFSVVIPATEMEPEKEEVQTVNSYKVMLYLPVPIPLEKRCWIRINMPKSLSIVTEFA